MAKSSLSEKEHIKCGTQAGAEGVRKEHQPKCPPTDPVKSAYLLKLPSEKAAVRPPPE